MADKEIIIDGVDVRDCKNYNSEEYWACKPHCCHCEELPNCYFKQLKRAEQKLNKIKNRCIEYMEVFRMQGVDPKDGGYDHILQIIKGEENE